MDFYPVSWESDIGPSYNYHVNASNAFVTAGRLAGFVNSIPGRRIVIAHSLGTMVAASAIQDYGMNTSAYMKNTWPRPVDGELGGRFLHSDIKNMAYFFVYPVFKKIVEIGGLDQ